MTDPAVLILTGQWPAPSETFILRDLLALRDAGFPFVLAAIRGQAGIEVAGISADVILTEDAPELSDSRQLNTDFCLRRPKGASTPWNPILALRMPIWDSIRGAPLWPSETKNDRSAGARSQVMGLGRKWCHREAVVCLRNYVRGSGIRHLHAAHLDLPGYLVGEVARSLCLSFSLEGHARDVFCSNFPLAGLCRGASHVSVCNDAARAFLANRVQASTVVLLRHAGPEVSDAYPIMKKHGPIRLLFVGRLVAKKGVLDAIRIAEMLAELENRPVKLTIVGDGPQRSVVEVAAHGVSPEVICEITGWLDQLAVDDLMRHHADCLLLPAQVDGDGDRDGIANVVLEAMAVGLPVVASPVGGIGEVLTPETGWPFAWGELESACLAIQSLISNPDDARRRALCAKNLLNQQFSPRVAAESRMNLWLPHIS